MRKKGFINRHNYPLSTKPYWRINCAQPIYSCTRLSARRRFVWRLAQILLSPLQHFLHYTVGDHQCIRRSHFWSVTFDLEKKLLLQMLTAVYSQDIPNNSNHRCLTPQEDHNAWGTTKGVRTKLQGC